MKKLIVVFIISVLLGVAIGYGEFCHIKKTGGLAIENKSLSAQLSVLKDLHDTSPKLYDELESDMVTLEITEKKNERLLKECREEKFEPRALIIK